MSARNDLRKSRTSWSDAVLLASLIIFALIAANPLRAQEKKNGFEENVRGCVYNRREEQKKSRIVGAEWLRECVEGGEKQKTAQ